MFSEFSYPIICTKKFVKTVNFYEDYLDFELAFEMEGFSVLKRKDWDDVYLAVIDVEHEAIPDSYRKETQGVILNFPVFDVDMAYDTVYHDGLDIVSQPDNSLCGRKHFFIQDPNGILIDIAQNVPLSDVMDEDQIFDKCFVA